MKKIIVVAVTLITSIYFFSMGNTFAEENDYSFDFSVESLQSEKQIDKDKPYFNLRMSPNEEEEIYIRISNNSDVDTIYEINVNQAYTNKLGYIEYINTGTDIEMDDSLKYPIDEIVSYENLVLVPANTEKNVPLKITMPTDEFDGIISAGIIVSKFDDTDDDENQNLITNKFSYTIGLTISESDVSVEREIKLYDVYPDLAFGNTSIVAKIANPKMDSYGHLKYKFSVMNLDSNKEFIANEIDNGMELAPNSIYKFAIDTDNKALIPGNYQLTLSISDKKGNTWDFNEPFEITKNEADRINTAALVSEKSLDKYLILGVLFGILVIVIFLYLQKKQKTKKNI